MTAADRARAYAQRIRDYADTLATRSGIVMGERWELDVTRTSPGHVSVVFPDANIRIASFGCLSDPENVRKALLAAGGVLERRQREQADGFR